jgi:hypothetical protein
MLIIRTAITPVGKNRQHELHWHPVAMLVVTASL